MTLKAATYHLLLQHSTSSVNTDVLWNTSIIFFVLAIVIIGFILFYKGKFLKYSIKKDLKRAELAPIISNFLFHSSQDSKDEQKEYVHLKIEIREYLKDSTFRKILAEILFDLQKDVSGSVENRLFKLYRQLGLHHDAFEKLENWRWHIISKGIIELTQMQVGESYHLITKFVNDKRSTIRKQAEIAAIKLRSEGITHILDHTRYPISEWQQLKMIEALSTLKNYKPPRFKSWLISENKDVVLFSLRLIKHYNQNDAAQSIIELVKHKNKEIQLAAIQCIKDFNFIEAKPVLRAIFSNCSAEVKIQILSVLAVFGDKTDIPFLNEAILNESNFLVKSKARSAINTISPDSILPEKDILNSQDLEKEIEINSLENESEEMESSINTENTSSEANIAVEIEEELVYTEASIIDIEEAPEEEFVFEIEEPTIVDETLVEEELIPVEHECEEIMLDFEMFDLSNDEIINKEIGLIPSKPEDTSGPDIENETLAEDYKKLSYREKDNFLNKMEHTQNSMEIDFLEDIIEIEKEPELRYNAFKKLKDLKAKFLTTKIIENEEQIEEKPVKEQTLDAIEEIKMLSVFYPLYKKANDIDSKLILIDQMGLLGDEKEIAFLKTIKTNNEPSIAKAIKKSIALLETKNTPNTEDDLVENNQAVSETVLNKSSEDKEKETLDAAIPDEFKVALENLLETEIVKEDDKLPLELCFLHDDFELKPSKPKESEFNFELSEEFFLNNNNR